MSSSYRNMLFHVLSGVATLLKQKEMLLVNSGPGFRHVRQSGKCLTRETLNCFNKAVGGSNAGSQSNTINA